MARRSRSLQKQRFEAFSDGVFAIAITLLVLDIAVPVGSEKNPLGAFIDQWPTFLAYIVSFASIGAIWLGHTVITDNLESSNGTLVRLNLILLLFVSFLPFPTRLLAEYIKAEESERVATTLYGVVLLICAGLLSLLWRYAVRAKLVHGEIDESELSEVTERLVPGLVAYLALIVAGLFFPVVALLGYLAIALFFLFPIRLHSRRRALPTDTSTM